MSDKGWSEKYKKVVEAVHNLVNFEELIVVEFKAEGIETMNRKYSWVRVQLGHEMYVYTKKFRQ